MGQGGGMNLIGWEPYIGNKYTKGDGQSSYRPYDPISTLQWVLQFPKNKRQTVMVVFDWIGHTCSTVKLKDVTDADIEEDKRRLRDRCLPWDYPTVLVAIYHDNACKIEKPQLSIVGGKGEG